MELTRESDDVKVCRPVFPERALRIPDLKILYRDRRICIVDKPPRVFVHHNRLEPETPNCVDELSRRIGTRVYNVHRLDRATSGALVFALDRESASDISKQFREGEVAKRYVAVVRGHLEEETVVDRPVRKSKKGPRVEALSRVKPITTSTIPVPLGRFDEIWYSFVEIQLFTGRYHQARSHLRSIDHPIIGDTTHGDRTQNAHVRRCWGIADLLLRAYEIGLKHPETGERLECITGLPEWWLDALDAMCLGSINGIPANPRVRRFRP